MEDKRSNSLIFDKTRPNTRVVINNKKKEQMNEDKVTEIERENRILYEKMLRIQNRRKNNSFQYASIDNHPSNPLNTRRKMRIAKERLESENK